MGGLKCRVGPNWCLSELVNASIASNSDSVMKFSAVNSSKARLVACLVFGVDRVKHVRTATGAHAGSRSIETWHRLLVRATLYGIVVL